jgi:catalase
VRGKAERFADHYSQATLFFNSQTPVEQQHIINAFRFELSKVQVPAIRERMVSSLRNVSEELAEAVAEGLGITELPPPMPKVMQKKVRAEVVLSKPLSLFARRGDVGIQARRIAILIADGVDGDEAKAIAARIRAEARCRLFVAPRLGAVRPAKGAAMQADASLEIAPSVLFDAVAVVDGRRERRDIGCKWPGRTEFLKDQYRHCKAMLISGAAQLVLEKAGIPATLPTGDPDPRHDRRRRAATGARSTRSLPRSRSIVTTCGSRIRR